MCDGFISGNWRTLFDWIGAGRDARTPNRISMHGDRAGVCVCVCVAAHKGHTCTHEQPPFVKTK